MTLIEKTKNLAPEEIDSIDVLLEEGDMRVQTTLMVGHVLGPAVPPAEAYYERALQLGISDPEKEFKARYGLGTFLALNWDKKGAIPHLQRAIELKPNDYNSRFVMGKLYEDTGRFAEASREFLKAASVGRSPRSLYRSFTNWIKTVL